jgi:hypothetical protein
MSFIRVVDTLITQEIEPKEEPSVENDNKATNRIVFSEIEQSKYDVLYGDSLQRPTGKR